MRQIAIYGKGGIGKSTIAANLSAALADSGARVLQIGCDPKHDSTRLLLNGKQVITVLDYMRSTEPLDRSLQDVLYPGYLDVHCVEAGGPEPGVGCAGRGILSTFELLDTLGIHQIEYDIALYDVLGDVVCGGFAVPLRREYADMVYIVTSGEFMAIYAANNILRGVENYDQGRLRLGGLILNRRGVEDEEGRVRRFSDAVGLPVITSLPRSDQFSRAESRKETILEAFPRTPLADEFRAFAAHLLDNPDLHAAHPLLDSELERVVLGNRDGNQPDEAEPEQQVKVHDREKRVQVRPRLRGKYLSKSVRRQEPLRGCAFTGAVHTTLQIRDAVTVGHAPRSCSHLTASALISSARRTEMKFGIVLPEQVSLPLISSDMKEDVAIFGGNDELEQALRIAAADHPPVVFVITSCAPGIIGDDVEGMINRVQSDFEGTKFIPILTDGNINGDYSQGVISACVDGIGSLIDPDISPEKDRVNIIAEKNLANNTESNFLVIKELLSGLGLKVNCRFGSRSAVGEVEEFLRGTLNLLAYDDAHGRALREYLQDRFPTPFAPHAFSVGVQATERWLESIAEHFGKKKAVEPLVSKQRKMYQEKIRRLKPYLTGKKIMLVTYGHEIDWVLQTALDLEMEIIKVAVMEQAYDDQFRTRFEVPVELKYPVERIKNDAVDMAPDLVLSNFYQVGDLPGDVRSDVIPMVPDVGFLSGPNLAERWYRIIKAPVRAGWRVDADLF